MPPELEQFQGKSSIMYVWQVINLIMASFFVLAALANVSIALHCNMKEKHL